MGKLLPVVLLMALGLAGCAKKTVIVPGGGTVTTDSAGKEATVTTSDGTATVKQGADGSVEMTGTNAKGETSTFTAGKSFPDSELGVAVYAGASSLDSDRAKIAGDKATTWMAPFTTPDSIEKVVAFYKGQFKADAVTTTPDTGMVIGKNAAGRQVTVMAEKKDNLTKFTISVIEEKKP